MSLMGYANRFSARPGDTIEFKVSCSEDTFDASLVRLRGSMWPKRPIEPKPVESAISGRWPGRLQPVPIGSWVGVSLDPLIAMGEGVTIGCYVMPTTVLAGREQGIVSLVGERDEPGMSIAVNPEGCLEIGVGGDVARSVEPLINGRWYAVVATWSPSAGPHLRCTMTARSWLPAQNVECAAIRGDAEPVLAQHVLFGVAGIGQDGRPDGCFNGKIGRPIIVTGVDADEVGRYLDGEIPNAAEVTNVAAAWDFSKEMSTDRVVESSGRNSDGQCHNQPMRAVTGARWEAREIDPRLAPGEYDAIMFHEDDLADCRWQTDISWTVPDSLEAGVYAARIEAGGAVDHIPVYIRSAIGSSKPPMLYLAPTNTYLAYGNERLYAGIDSTPDFVEKSIQDPITLTERDHFLTQHPEIGASAYDIHPDKTGICYSSRLRPVVTMRPEASSWTTGHPRHFSADLFLIEWLEHLDFHYDVATDEDLHREGMSLLSDYAVVVTGSHPEYWTEQGMNVLEEYLGSGGRLMYLGGNGFYWVTGTTDDAPHIVEIRRGISGTRAWNSHPGEIHLSTTGGLGGLWRNRGRFPNQMVGVGFASQGWGGAPGYSRLPDSYRDEAAFVFEGIDQGDVLGDFGLVMGGAAGDEIDRYDLDLGTPTETLRLATTEGKHSDYYQLVIEDCNFMLAGRGGAEDSRVRSDITLVQDPVNGGAVFSVGSINWIGSLMWNDGDNNISRMTANVLRRFQER